MAFERFANLASTHLTANYTAGDGSITVTSTAAPWPSSGNFRVFIADAATGVVKVILKVTAVTDGTHFACTAEGSDANASSGDVVKMSITAGGLDAMRGDMHQRGAWASKVANKAGNLYLPSDGLMFGRDNGSSFDSYGPTWALGDPNLQTWTQQDFGSCTTDALHGGITIVNPTTEGAFNTHALVFNAPATPYHVEFGYSRWFATNGTNCMAGACFSDGTKYEIYDPQFQNSLTAHTTFYLSNSTSFGGNTPLNTNLGNVLWAGGLFWVRLGDDGTHKTWDFSNDGFTWIQDGSETSASNFTATKVGFYIDNGPGNIRLVHCKVTG